MAWYTKDTRPVKFLRIFNGSWDHNPMGIIPGYWSDPTRIHESVVRALNLGYERIILSLPAGLYPGTTMGAAQFYAMRPEIREVVMSCLRSIPSPGVYIGSSMYLDDETGQPLSAGLGHFGTKIVEPTMFDFREVWRPWTPFVRELWVDAVSGPEPHRRAFMEAALSLWREHGTRVVGEAWPTYRHILNPLTLRMHPDALGAAWFATDRFVSQRARQGLSMVAAGNRRAELYIGLLDGSIPLSNFPTGDSVVPVSISERYDEFVVKWGR